MNESWIKLSRAIQTHWLWQKDDYLKAWLTILMHCNAKDGTAMIHGELIECKRGQCLYSLQTWTRHFGKKWTIQRTRHFLNLLEKDEMILLEGLRKTTRLTVCNYEVYQNSQQTNNTQTTSKQHSNNTQTTTTKEVLEFKERKELFIAAVAEVNGFPESMKEDFVNYWTEANPKGKMRFEFQKIFEISRRLATWKKNADKIAEKAIVLMQNKPTLGNLDPDEVAEFYGRGKVKSA